MAQLAIELFAAYMIESPLPVAEKDCKKYAKDLACLALARKTTRTGALLGRAAVAYAKYADLAVKVWRNRARMYEEERWGSTALRWQRMCFFADEQRRHMREAMTAEMYDMDFALRALEEVPEVQVGTNVNQQIGMCVRLCVLRGNVLRRFEAQHPEFIPELRQMELDTDSERAATEEEVDPNDEQL